MTKWTSRQSANSKKGSREFSRKLIQTQFNSLMKSVRDRSNEKHTETAVPTQFWRSRFNKKSIIKRYSKTAKSKSKNYKKD